jgi:ferredoxin
LKPSAKYSNAIIFYFSGTGNARIAAHWITETLRNQGIDAIILNISDHPNLSDINLSPSTLIGFCYPTHGFNAPPIVIKFIRRFPKTSKADVFLLNTRAGMKLSKLFIPGLSGLAQILPALILLLKGYRIAAMQPMDLPSNWISLHPGLRKKVVDSIFVRCKRITKQFTEKLLAGKKVYKALYSLPLDLLISPVSIGYYFYARFMLAKTFFASYNCNNCGLCIKNCPVHAIKVQQGRPYWSFSCESCMKCMNNCPKNAIETPHGFTFVLWWGLMAFIPILVFDKIKSLLPDFTGEELILKAINLSFMAISVWLAYHLFHFLLRFKFFNYIITYTSLTKLPFWRRYKAGDSQY